jgi:hypothetical protein
MSPSSTPPPPEEADYQAIESAVIDVAHGDWFLEEYARRQRRQDTDRLIAALVRIERVANAADRFKVDQVALDKALSGIKESIALAKAAAQDHAGEIELTSAFRRLEEQISEVAGLLRPVTADRDGRIPHDNTAAPSIAPNTIGQTIDSDASAEEFPSRQFRLPLPNRLAAIEDLVGKTCAWLNEVNDTPHDLT